MKKICGLVSLLLISSLISCSNTTTNPSGINSFKITKNDVVVEELDVFVGDTFALKTKVNDNLTPAVTWKSSDPSVVDVDPNGNVNVLKKGSVVVSATVNDSPYICDSIYIDATKPLGQTGVGSGLSSSDPIFLGN